jgi:protein-S-isoprenylcysteine O-methyltransferase Ste14
VVIQFALFALVAFGPRTLPGLPLWPAALTLPAQLLGAALLLAGAVLAALGVRQLGANLSALPHPKAGAALVDRGVYALVRHPIYGGLILAALGWACLGRSSATLLYTALLILLFDRKSRREEAQLRLALPAYDAYRTRTRRFLPWLY